MLRRQTYTHGKVSKIYIAQTGKGARTSSPHRRDSNGSLTEIEQFDDFSKEQKHHILRIIQEALNNAQTHAKASETSIVIRKGRSENRRSEPVSEKQVQAGEDFMKMPICCTTPCSYSAGR